MHDGLIKRKFGKFFIQTFFVCFNMFNLSVYAVKKMCLLLFGIQAKVCCAMFHHIGELLAQEILEQQIVTMFFVNCLNSFI